MIREVSRREIIRGGAALAGLAALGVPDWLLAAQAPAAGEEVIPWTDVPANFMPSPPTGLRTLDTRNLQRSTFFTANEDFFAVQHYPVPTVDPATYKLRLTGLVNKPMELTLDELKRRPRVELVACFECSGNNPARLNTLTGNARWAGASVSALLKDAGLKPTAREVVFFGFDKSMEDIAHGTPRAEPYEQHFGRSLAVEDAGQPQVMLAWEMNGAPLPPKNGGPVRLIVPGWYGVANTKWLDHMHVQDSRFMGRFMARDYVQLMETKEGDDEVWNETSVSRMQLKTMVARLTRNGGRYTATGYALNDGTPLKSVEVRVDGGPWQPVTMEKGNTQYSWKLFTYQWTGLAPGDHTIVSRATDINGAMQPEESDLATKKTRWENNAQFTRKFKV
jgi:DMSO/TMAO reductase YedYZ molybdopterin-dependent catalytic subunit